MNIKLGLLGILGLVGGCASTGAGPGRPEADFSGFTRGAAPSMVVGDARVVDARVNPLVPVQASAEGDAVTLRFGRPRHATGVARLHASSFELVAVDGATAGGDATSLPQTSRVLLDGGRFIVCWKHGDAERGYQALAQVFEQDGAPAGAPAVISPPDVDVVGAPQVLTTDGRHVLATFAAAADSAFELLAVPIEDVSGAEVTQVAARR
jgi:hypothetical protein